MDTSFAYSQPERALATAYQIKKHWRMPTSKCCDSRAPLPSTTRLDASLNDTPFELCEYLEQAESKRGTVLYLAYGSNLSKETFRGNRGIKPISQVNVQVPSLRLTFDLPGIPYAEPCFANTARRDPEEDRPQKRSPRQDQSDEKTPLLARGAQREDYHKDRWHKGLIGVVYEVTPQDYAHIIQTEGGGASYHDILVDCHPFESSDPHTPVPQDPTRSAFKAHTLFAPAEEQQDGGATTTGRFKRPDTSYAQASARYLKLITDGAEELELPYEYQDFLLQLRPYTITTSKQRIGQFIFLSLWMPLVAFIFGAGKMFADDKGRLPDWMVRFMEGTFGAIWGSYDGLFKKMFGDGERTIGEGGSDSPGDDEEAEQEARLLKKRWRAGVQEVEPDVEKAVLRGPEP